MWNDEWKNIYTKKKKKKIQYQQLSIVCIKFVNNGISDSTFRITKKNFYFQQLTDEDDLKIFIFVCHFGIDFTTNY